MAIKKRRNVDTNVLLRAFDLNHAMQPVAAQAITDILTFNRGDFVRYGVNMMNPATV